MLTNEPNNFTVAGVNVIGISDHNLIYAIRKHSSVKSKPITIQSRNFKCFNETNFKRDIESVPWYFIGYFDDPIKALETWKGFFLQISDKHAPRRVRKTCAPWLSTEIKNLMWERDRLKRKAVITNDENDWTNFKTKKNLVNYKIRNNKKQYYNSFFQNNVGRTRKTWKGINSLLSKDKNSINIPKVVVNDTEITDPVAVAVSNAFNKHFTEIEPNLVAQIPPTSSSTFDNIHQSNQIFELHVISSVPIFFFFI